MHLVSAMRKNKASFSKAAMKARNTNSIMQSEQ